mgnify:CR=1 FL=1|tara:strand:- start:321 stop:503 length:183 start_codon:yes stop_codon:yes gene_type:complete
MPRYKVHYSEENTFYKVFEAKSKEEANEKAHKEMSDNGWDTSTWETGNGGGGQFFDTEKI